MAIESQGVVLRRESTVAGESTSLTSSNITFTSTSGSTNLKISIGSLAGYSTDMRLYNNSSANSTKVYLMASVIGTTAMNFYAAPIVGQTSGIEFTIEGIIMTPIGQVTGFNGPSGSANVIDITSLASTSKEKLMGLRDEGQLTMDILFDPATADASLHNALRTDKETRTKRKFEITLTDQVSTAVTDKPTFHSFDAFVTGLSITGAVDDAVKGSVTLEITSAVKTTLRTT